MAGATTGLFVRLDVNWVDHDKIIAVGLDGAGLHAAAMCLAKRMNTDGVISRVQLARIGATGELVDRLIAEGLFDRVDDRRIAVHGWLDRNPSTAEYSVYGRLGNHKRYRHPGPFDKCPKCQGSSPTSGGEQGEEEASTGEISTDEPSDSTLSGDNSGDNSNGQVTRHASPPESPPDRQATRPPIASRSPHLLETETETETETELEEAHRSARELSPPPVDNLDPDELAAREALAHITTLHRQHHPPEQP